jgi:hypothetical protein
MSSPPQQKEDPIIINKIVNILNEYRKKYVNKDTLTSQDPNKLNEIKATLQQKATAVNNYFNNPSAYVSDANDTEINTLINQLNAEIQDHPDNPIYPILIGRYTGLMFIQFPLTLSVNHIHNLTKTQV